MIKEEYEKTEDHSVNDSRMPLKDDSVIHEENKPLNNQNPDLEKSQDDEEIEESYYQDPLLHDKFKRAMKFNPEEFLLTNSDKIRRTYDIIKVLDTALLLLILAFFVQMFTYKEYQWTLKDDDRERIILYGVLANVIISSAFRTYKFMLKNELAIMTKDYPKDIPLWKNPTFRKFLFEAGFNLIHPSPFLVGKSYSVFNSTVKLFVGYELNDILCFLSLIRIYYIMKQFFASTSFMSLKMQRIVRIFGGEEPGLLFSIKCYILTKPTQFLIVSFLFSVFVFSFLILMFERPIARISTHTDLASWNDVIWFCVITMTTIGYGDRTPYTQPARMTVLFLMIWGSLWTAIFISTVFPLITLDTSEYKAFNLFERTNKRQELEDTAAIVVANSVKILRELTKKADRVENYNKQFLDKSQVNCLRQMKKLSGLRKEMDTLVIETLYFEDDMLTKLELVLTINSQITKLQIKIEDIYKKIFMIPEIEKAKNDEDPSSPISKRKKNTFKIFDDKRALEDAVSVKSIPKSRKRQVVEESEDESEESLDQGWLPPGSKSHVCFSHSRVRFDSFESDSSLNGAILHKNVDFDIEKPESEIVDDENVDNKHLQFSNFLPVYVTFGREKNNWIPTYIQNVSFVGMNSPSFGKKRDLVPGEQKIVITPFKSFELPPLKKPIFLEGKTIVKKTKKGAVNAALLKEEELKDESLKRPAQNFYRPEKPVYEPVNPIKEVPEENFPVFEPKEEIVEEKISDEKNFEIHQPDEWNIGNEYEPKTPMKITKVASRRESNYGIKPKNGNNDWGFIEEKPLKKKPSFKDIQIEEPRNLSRFSEDEYEPKTPMKISRVTPKIEEEDFPQKPAQKYNEDDIQFGNEEEKVNEIKKPRKEEEKMESKIEEKEEGMGNKEEIVKEEEVAEEGVESSDIEFSDDEEDDEEYEEDDDEEYEEEDVDEEEGKIEEASVKETPNRIKNQYDEANNFKMPSVYSNKGSIKSIPKNNGNESSVPNFIPAPVPVPIPMKKKESKKEESVKETPEELKKNKLEEEFSSEKLTESKNGIKRTQTPPMFEEKIEAPVPDKNSIRRPETPGMLEDKLEAPVPDKNSIRRPETPGMLEEKLEAPVPKRNHSESLNNNEEEESETENSIDLISHFSKNSGLRKNPETYTSVKEPKSKKKQKKHKSMTSSVRRNTLDSEAFKERPGFEEESMLEDQKFSRKNTPSKNSTLRQKTPDDWSSVRESGFMKNKPAEVDNVKNIDEPTAPIFGNNLANDSIKDNVDTPGFAYGGGSINPSPVIDNKSRKSKKNSRRSIPKERSIQSKNSRKSSRRSIPNERSIQSKKSIKAASIRSVQNKGLQRPKTPLEKESMKSSKKSENFSTNPPFAQLNIPDSSKHDTEPDEDFKPFETPTDHNAIKFQKPSSEAPKEPQFGRRFPRLKTPPFSQKDGNQDSNDALTNMIKRQPGGPKDPYNNFVSPDLSAKTPDNNFMKVPQSRSRIASDISNESQFNSKNPLKNAGNSVIDTPISQRKNSTPTKKFGRGRGRTEREPPKQRYRRKPRTDYILNKVPTFNTGPDKDAKKLLQGLNNGDDFEKAYLDLKRRGLR